MRYLAKIALLLIAVSLEFPAVSSADTHTRTASARALFEQGLGHADRGEWAAAADLFERTLALRYSPQVAFNLALARRELGQVVEAHKLLTRVLEEAAPGSSVALAAHRELDATRARIARIEVRTTGLRSDLQYRLDGKLLSPAELGVPLPVNPGLHRIEALKGQEILATEVADVAQGAFRGVSVSVPPPPPLPKEEAPPPVQPLATTAEPERADSKVPLRKRWWFWTAVTGTLAGVGVAVWLSTRSTGPKVAPGDFNPGALEF